MYIWKICFYAHQTISSRSYVGRWVCQSFRGVFHIDFFSMDSVACLPENVTGDTIHWCGGNFGIAFAILVHGQKIGSSQHSWKKYFSKTPKKVAL